MKAIIPLAGRGTRLRPHTLTTPKPLVRVAGKPVMSYILDDFPKLGIEEVVFIVGYLGDEVRRFVAEEYPNLKARYVVQEVQDGTAGAIKLAEPFADQDLLIIFVDTLFDADISLASRLGEEWAGIIWAKEVEDYQRFGVIVTDEEGAMTRIVEKPSEPISRLANIGLYYIRDSALLFEGINHTLQVDPGPSGEYYLTDAFQYMVDQGARIQTAPVGGWYDCGKVETLLETNAHLLESGRGTRAEDVSVDGASTVDEAVRLEAGVRITGSTVGRHVTLEHGSRIEDSSLENCIVGPNATIVGSHLRDSMVGGDSVVRGVRGRFNVGGHSSLEGSDEV